MSETFIFITFYLPVTSGSCNPSSNPRSVAFRCLRQIQAHLPNLQPNNWRSHCDRTSSEWIFRPDISTALYCPVNRTQTYIWKKQKYSFVYTSYTQFNNNTLTKWDETRRSGRSSCDWLECRCSCRLPNPTVVWLCRGNRWSLAVRRLVR